MHAQPNTRHPVGSPSPTVRIRAFLEAVGIVLLLPVSCQSIGPFILTIMAQGSVHSFYYY